MLHKHANSNFARGNAEFVLIRSCEIGYLRHLLFSDHSIGLWSSVGHLALRCLCHFPLDAMLDSIEYIVHSSHGSEPWLGALAEDTSPDKNGVPGVLT